MEQKQQLHQDIVYAFAANAKHNMSSKIEELEDGELPESIHIQRIKKCVKEIINDFDDTYHLIEKLTNDLCSTERMDNYEDLFTWVIELETRLNMYHLKMALENEAQW